MERSFTKAGQNPKSSVSRSDLRSLSVSTSSSRNSLLARRNAQRLTLQRGVGRVNKRVSSLGLARRKRLDVDDDDPIAKLVKIPAHMRTPGRRTPKEANKQFRDAELDHEANEDGSYNNGEKGAVGRVSFALGGTSPTPRIRGKHLGLKRHLEQENEPVAEFVDVPPPLPVVEVTEDPIEHRAIPERTKRNRQTAKKSTAQTLSLSVPRMQTTAEETADGAGNALRDRHEQEAIAGSADPPHVETKQIAKKRSRSVQRQDTHEPEDVVPVQISHGRTRAQRARAKEMVNGAQPLQLEAATDTSDGAKREVPTRLEPASSPKSAQGRRKTRALSNREDEASEDGLSSNSAHTTKVRETRQTRRALQTNIGESVEDHSLNENARLGDLPRQHEKVLDAQQSAKETTDEQAPAQNEGTVSVAKQTKQVAKRSAPPRKKRATAAPQSGKLEVAAYDQRKGTESRTRSKAAQPVWETSEKESSADESSSVPHTPVLMVPFVAISPRQVPLTSDADGSDKTGSVTATTNGLYQSTLESAEARSYVMRERSEAAKQNHAMYYSDDELIVNFVDTLVNVESLESTALGPPEQQEEMGDDELSEYEVTAQKNARQMRKNQQRTTRSSTVTIELNSDTEMQGEANSHRTRSGRVRGKLMPAQTDPTESEPQAATVTGRRTRRSRQTRQQQQPAVAASSDLTNTPNNANRGRRSRRQVAKPHASEELHSNVAETEPPPPESGSPVVPVVVIDAEPPDGPVERPSRKRTKSSGRKRVAKRPRSQPTAEDSSTESVSQPRASASRRTNAAARRERQPKKPTVRRSARQAAVNEKETSDSSTDPLAALPNPTESASRASRPFAATRRRKPVAREMSSDESSSDPLAHFSNHETSFTRRGGAFARAAQPRSVEHTAAGDSSDELAKLDDIDVTFARRPREELIGESGDEGSLADHDIMSTGRKVKGDVLEETAITVRQAVVNKRWKPLNESSKKHAERMMKAAVSQVLAGVATDRKGAVEQELLKLIGYIKERLSTLRVPNIGHLQSSTKLAQENKTLEALLIAETEDLHRLELRVEHEEHMLKQEKEELEKLECSVGSEVPLTKLHPLLQEQLQSSIALDTDEMIKMNLRPTGSDLLYKPEDDERLSEVQNVLYPHLHSINVHSSRIDGVMEAVHSAEQQLWCALTAVGLDDEIAAKISQ